MTGISVEVLAQGAWTSGMVVFIGLWLGFTPAQLLLHANWHRYRYLLMPIIGWSVLIFAAYYLNFSLLNMTQVFWSLVAIATAANITYFRYARARFPSHTIWEILVVVLSVFLLIVALLPHAHADSLGLLALNVDEELYFPYAELLKHFPASLTESGISAFNGEYQSVAFKSRGQGFAYLLSVTSMASGTPTFLAYMPLVHTMLGFSVVSTYIFARLGAGLNGRVSCLAATLYALNGLPFWFAGMGFGPHMTALAFMPVALAAIIQSYSTKKRSSAVFAGLMSAVLLASYFWAITAVYLAMCLPVIVLMRLKLQSMKDWLLRTSLVVSIGIFCSGPAIFWLLRWAVPQLTGIVSNLDGRFGNAWGDTSFPPLSSALGFHSYHMVETVSSLNDRLGPGPWGLIMAAQNIAWLLFIGFAICTVIFHNKNRPAILGLVFGSVAFTYWVWQIAGYPYGYFKNLSYISFLAATLLAAGIGLTWNFQSLAHHQLSKVVYSVKKVIVVLAMATLLIVLIVNSAESFRWYWHGFNWNMPHAALNDAQSLAKIIPKGSSVAISPKLRYPVDLSNPRFLPITLAFHYKSDAVSRWSNRFNAILISELPGRNVHSVGGNAYGPPSREAITNHPFVVLGQNEDPRLYGFTSSDLLFESPRIRLFSNPNDLVLRITDASDSANFSRLQFKAAVNGISMIHSDNIFGASGIMRVMMGIANMDSKSNTISVVAGPMRQSVTLKPGLNWITTNKFEGPATLTISSAKGVSSNVHPILMRALPATDDSNTATASFSSNPSILSVNTVLKGQFIESVITLINVENAANGIGLTYHESLTRGFWRSSLALPLSSTTIRLKYDVNNRSIIEDSSYNNPMTSIARESSAKGEREFSLRFSKGDEIFEELVLYKYTMTEKGINITYRPTNSVQIFYPEYWLE
tara:strand:+ start:2970 stop:5729 length:2760 start_codon:yes stop_codon:yes gene_type:complete